MLVVVAAVVALLVAGIGIYVWWDRLVPPSGQVSMQYATPTRLQDKRVPGFSLPGLIDRGFEARDLLFAKKPTIVKFWGPWSSACILEYPILLELQAARVEVWAIAFRDSRTNALDYLERNGNPYTRVAYDAAGRVASDWGVTSAPSTFLVDGEGFVRWHRAGPLTPQIVARELRPLLERFAP